MKKAELIKNVAEAANVSKKDAEAVMNALVTELGQAMKKGDDVRIPGLGTFTTRTRAERVAKNPRTGETVTVPSATVPSFKAGKELKDLING